MLAKYETSIAAKPDSEFWQAVQVHVQDAVSELSEKAIELGANQ